MWSDPHILEHGVGSPYLLITLAPMSHKKGHRVAADVKADILRRIKEGGVSVAQAAQEHGLHETTIYDWLSKGADGAPTLVRALRMALSSRYYVSRQAPKDWALKVHSEQLLREQPGYGYRRVALALNINKERALAWSCVSSGSRRTAFKTDLGDPSRFRSLGELVAEVHRLIYAYNHTRIHSALKMPPSVFAEKNAHRRMGVGIVEKHSEFWGS